METDGNYLYMLSQGQLVIVDLRAVDTPTIAARLTLKDSPTAMYLDGDRLTLISAGYVYPSAFERGGPVRSPWPNHGYGRRRIRSHRAQDHRQHPVRWDPLGLPAIGDQLYLVFQPTDLGSALGGPNIVHSDGTPLAAGESPVPLQSQPYNLGVRNCHVAGHGLSLRDRTGIRRPNHGRAWLQPAADLHLGRRRRRPDRRRPCRRSCPMSTSRRRRVRIKISRRSPRSTWRRTSPARGSSWCRRGRT